MTEYKIVLYYEKPMPEFFQSSMEAMLKRGVEQGFISGYEFQKKELESGTVIKQTTLKDSAEIRKKYEESIKAASELEFVGTEYGKVILKEIKKDERKPVQDNTSGLDTRAEKGVEELRGEGKPRGSGSKHKEIRSDKPDNRKKGGK